MKTIRIIALACALVTPALARAGDHNSVPVVDQNHGWKSGLAEGTLQTATEGQVLIGQASGTNMSFKSLSGDVAITAAGVVTVTGAVAEELLLETATELTLDTNGDVAKTAGLAHFTIDTFSDAASDTLRKMTGGAVGNVLWIHPNNDARTVIVEHDAATADEFRCPGAENITLAEDTDWVLAVHDGTGWAVLAFNTLATSGGGLGTALASVSVSKGASLVSVEDASAYYTGTTVEVALDEVEAQLGGDTSVTFDFTEANVCVDDDAVYACMEKIDLEWGDLASAVNAEGAALVGVEDPLGLLGGATVEAALAELAEGPSNVNIETLAAGKTILLSTALATDSRWQVLDPDAATRIVTLPAETARLWYVIRNSGTEASDVLTVNDDAAGLVATINAGESAFVVSDGTSWGIVYHGPSSTTLASTGASLGASLIGIEDSATIITATTVEGALAENRAAIDALEVQTTAIIAENTDGQAVIPILTGVGDAGTWTAAVTSGGLETVTRSAGAATESFWVPIPMPSRTTASRGFKPTGIKVNYTVDTADASDIRAELWKVTQGADNAARTAAVIVGEADADYDAAHDTAAERGDDTTAPELHLAVVTDAAGAAYVGAGETLLLRFVVVDPGTSVVVLTSAVLLYSETLVDGS